MHPFSPLSEPQRQLSPFLACLPVASATPLPPPALLPLLSPILRQRVQLLHATGTRSDSWLPLLCWSEEHGERLPSILNVSGEALEPHPVSGEIELEDVAPPQFRRLDAETLQARIKLSRLELEVQFVWCPEDIQEAENGGWRVSELSPLTRGEELGGGPVWFFSIREAEAAFSTRQGSPQAGYTTGLRSRAISLIDAPAPDINLVAVTRPTTQPAQPEDTSIEDSENEDDYWRQYDQSAGQTPGQGQSPRPPASKAETNGHHRASSDDEYYSRYAEVQPEMDNDDPSSRAEDEPQDSSLRGNTLEQALQINGAQSTTTSYLAAAQQQQDASSSSSHVVYPWPAQPRDDSIARLEESALRDSQPELGIRQHVSSSIKSLFRLARAAGIEREDFVGLVERELDVLSMLDEDVD
jgi:hypothetical protein